MKTKTSTPKSIGLVSIVALALLLPTAVVLAAPAALLETPAAWDAIGPAADAHLGMAVAGAGDVNGDGFSDLLVAAPDYDGGAGAVFVYHGGPDGPGETPARVLTSTQTAASHFGATLAGAGDVNGDGYWDIVVGAPDYDGGAGAVFVYYGGPDGLPAAPDWSLLGSAQTHPGAAVAGAGDVNGDGYDDLLVAVTGYSGGSVAVYFGGPTGLSGLGTELVGDQAGEQFGAALAGAGDVNGDGYNDIAVGAPGYDLDGTAVISDAGRVLLYLGGPGGTINVPAWSITGSQAGERLGLAVAGAGDVDGDGYSDLLVASSAAVTVYRGGAGGLADPTRLDGAEATVAGAGDVNGDGCADILIGQPAADGGAGTVGLYLGGLNGLSSAADLVLPGWPTAEFGAAVAGAGDVDGDGYGDILIGAPGYDRTQDDQGGAFLYRGQPDGPTTSPAWTKTGWQWGGLFGWAVAGAGDVNGDGFADLLAAAPRAGTDEEGRAYLFLGRAGGLDSAPVWTGRGGQAWAWFGASLAAGDVNGDGYDDLLIAAPRYDDAGHDDGRVFLYLGGPDGPGSAPERVITPPDQGTADFDLCPRFGFALAIADVNGDGYGDALITANGYDQEGRNEGAAFLYLGGPDGLTAAPVWAVHPTDQDYANFGRAAAGLGDVNGDGYDDLAVGAPWYDPGAGGDYRDRGAVYVYYGSAAGPAAAADVVLSGAVAEELFGAAVAGAGDVNGDGYDDLAVGAYQSTLGGNGRAGRAVVFYGGAAGLDVTPDWAVNGTRDNERYGIALAGVGDVNGDGYDDLLVGASDYGDESMTPHPGAAFVYYGGPAGPSTTADWQGDGGQSGAGYGLALAGAGDVNGDGFADLAVGAPTYNGMTFDDGAVFVHLGGGGRGTPVLPRQCRPVSTAPLPLGGASDAADRVCLRVTGRSPLGRSAVTFRWQVAPATTPFTAAGSISGTASTWTDALPAHAALSQTVGGLVGGEVYRWRLRLVYRPGNLLWQTAGRWLYPTRRAAFRTPHLLTPARSGTASPGGLAVYSHTLHNPLAAVQVFTLTARSEHGYTVTVAGTRVLTGFAAAPVTVTVAVPGDAGGPLW